MDETSLIKTTAWLGLVEAIVYGASCLACLIVYLVYKIEDVCKGSKAFLMTSRVGLKNPFLNSQFWHAYYSSNVSTVFEPDSFFIYMLIFIIAYIASGVMSFVLLTAYREKNWKEVILSMKIWMIIGVLMSFLDLLFTVLIGIDYVNCPSDLEKATAQTERLNEDCSYNYLIPVIFGSKIFGIIWILKIFLICKIGNVFWVDENNYKGVGN